MDNIIIDLVLVLFAGVPLEDCPTCPSNDSLPMLVSTCCRIVEEKGLDIVGIYRVPGNSGAVNSLTSQINSGGEEVFVKLEDPKWGDVNVVSSLLKSFFRKLPEPLFTTDMYSVFIEASKTRGAARRLNSLRRQIRDLPHVHYETLCHLSRHLAKVVEHSELNKMDLKNLAIVFGPTLVRPADDNMLSLVTDMQEQCRIIESVISQFEWFFNHNEDDDLDEDSDEDDPEGVGGSDGNIAEAGHSQNNHKQSSMEPSTEIAQTSNQSVLLSNLQKLEDAGKMVSPSRDISAKEIVSGILSAANRKVMRAATQGKTSKKESVSSSSSNSKSQQKLDTIDSSSNSANGSQNNNGKQPASRRNSESVFHGAMAIAAAVPQLMVNPSNSASTSNLPAAAANAVSAITAVATSGGGNGKLSRSGTASQENLINVESTMTSSSTSRIVSTASYYEDSTGKKIKFPIETYQGLEEATAARVRRFEDETRAMLMRGRPNESSPNLNSQRTTSGKKLKKPGQN